MIYNTAVEFHYNMEVSERIRVLNLPQAYMVIVGSGLKHRNVTNTLVHTRVA